MQKTTKSLPTYIMDENHFKDFEYEFDYCIIHKEKDIDYLCGSLTSALAEFMTFKDNESLTYFLALLSQSKILIPVYLCPPGKNNEYIIKSPYCKNDSYLYMKNANVIPQIKTADNTKFLSTFLSIREIHNVAHNHMFLYVDFETVYKWIKKHRTEIDTITFDQFAKYYHAWYINVDDFINQIELFKKFVKSYKGKNLISDLHTISLQKHTSK